MPEPAVSVILPVYAQQEALNLTLEALARQDHSSYEIVVVDDGTDPPIEAPASIDGVVVRVVRQARDGFGLARARNTGARAAAGDVLIFLDCDMIPVPGFVTAHARHHEASDHAVVVGFRGHVDTDGVTAEMVRSAAESGDVGVLFSGADVDHPTWIERHWERTNDLRSSHHDKWRAMSGGNLSVRKELWALVGGADESSGSGAARTTRLPTGCWPRGRSRELNELPSPGIKGRATSHPIRRSVRYANNRPALSSSSPTRQSAILGVGGSFRTRRPCSAFRRPSGGKRWPTPPFGRYWPARSPTY